MAKIRKICLVLVYFIFLINVSGKLAAQTPLEKKYSISFHHISFGSVIDSLRKVIDYGISYNPEILPQHKILNLTFNNEPLNVIIDSIIGPFQLTYKVINNNIILSRKIVTKFEIPKTTDSIKYIQLNGRVLNKKNNESIPFVNIYIKNKNIGTISNNDGISFSKYHLKIGMTPYFFQVLATYRNPKNK